MSTLKKQVEFLRQQNLKHQQAAAQNQAEQYNKRKKAVEQTIKVGDTVRWRRPRLQRDQKKKLASIWQGPFTVIEKVGKVNFKLKDKNGQIAETLAHASDLSVVNGERPCLNIIRTKAYWRKYKFDRWCEERQKQAQPETKQKAKTK